MATTTIKCYLSDNWLPERNAIFDNKNVAKGALTYTFNNFQYQRPEMFKTIKLDLPQSQTVWMTFNLVEIINSDEPKPFYYFVSGKPKQLAQNTISVDLILDVLNSFTEGEDYEFTNKTKILREHKDRFTNTTRPTGGNTYKVFKVDKVPEGLNLNKYVKAQNESIGDTAPYLNQLWYLLYVSDTTDTQSAIRCELYPQKANIKLQSNDSISITLNATKIGDNEAIYVMDFNGENNHGTLFTPHAAGAQTLTIGTSDLTDGYKFAGFCAQKDGANIKYHIYGLKNGDYSVLYSATDLSVELSNIPSGAIKRVGPLEGAPITSNVVLTIQALEGKALNTTHALPVTAINRTNSKIQKIIECPYCPIDITFDTNNVAQLPTGWRALDGIITLEGLVGNSFEHTLPLKGIAPLYVNLGNTNPTRPKSMALEPKLLHSEVRETKFVYDSFTYPWYYENMDALDPSSNTAPEWGITYKQSDNITSSLAFKFGVVGATYNDPLDVPMLISTRNNEVQTYTNNYLNYMRIDYNYDKKLMNQQLEAQRTGAAISAVATGIGLMVKGPISAAAAISTGQSTLNSIVGILNNRKTQETQMAQKQADLQAQTTNIAGADDLSLFKYYNGNKLRLISRTCTDDMKQVVYDLFFKTGYASNRIGAPNMATRYWFDFCQCEADIKGLRYFQSSPVTPLAPEIKAELKARFSEGVTRWHYHNGYNFDYTYENFEVGLVNE